MKRKHIITLSGKPGSGKSSTADKVAEMLGYTRYSSGDFVREMVKKQHLTLAEFNKMAAQNHEVDHMIDEKLRELRDASDVVIDSRLGFYWIPESFKVYLDLNTDVATARIFKDVIENQSRETEKSQVSTLAEASKQVQKRLAEETQRFRALYGVDPYRRSNFDLIINTSRHSPQTVALTVFDNFKKWLQTEEWEQVYSEVPMGYSYDNEY